MEIKNDYYVLYCTEDKTYSSSSSGIWTKDILKATKYKDIDRIREVISNYNETIKIMKISMTVQGVIFTQ